MIKIGITGGIGSGKSTISEIFSLLRIPVYIADKESKRLLNQSQNIKGKLQIAFGNDLYKDEKLDKALFASLIFNDKEKLALANSIIHPEVETDFKLWCQEHRTYPIVIKEAAILFESGFNKFVDKTITVLTPLDMRITRTMRRDGVSRKQVLERINNQMPDEQKAKLSDFVIVNDESQSLIQQVLQIVNTLNSH